QLTVAGWTGALVVALLWSRADGTSPALYRGGFTVGALAAAVVIAAAVLQPSSALARVLSWAPLRAVGAMWCGSICGTGRCSACSAARTGLHGGALLAPRVAVTLVVAGASLLLVELPARRRSLPVGRPRAVLAAVGAAAVGAMVLVAPASAVPSGGGDATAAAGPSEPSRSRAASRRTRVATARRSPTPR
ncbi:MAG: hypothetical protein M3P48_10465, partial [Actinomycetota bacterium]|nr:hypothetical protein [Actinomycetota bacterium]